MPKEFSVPRGMKDIETQEMERRVWVEARILEVLRLYGFKMVEPTPLEHLETLEAKSGPQIRNEVYWFADKAGRNLGLRFDLTVGMARMVANRYDLPEPVKLCAVADAWRYDEPQFGRYRHFKQWDAEIFGSTDPLADAESICVGMDILENVGLKEYEVRISNRKLVESFLHKIRVRAGNQTEETLITIDKLSKLSAAQINEEFGKVGLSAEQINAVRDLCSIKGPPEKVLSEISHMHTENGAPMAGQDELVRLADVLKAFGRENRCTYDLSVVRGIGYYDGIVFEAYDRGGEDIGSIFGGGRYDKLCSIYGKQDRPATGVAGGIERLMISLERSSLYPNPPDTPKVYVASATEDVFINALGIVRELRQMGIASDFDMKGRSLQKQLEYAHSMKIPFTVIVGRKELDRGAIRLREMESRTEREMGMKEVAKELRARDNTP